MSLLSVQLRWRVIHGETSAEVRYLRLYALVEVLIRFHLCRHDKIVDIAGVPGQYAYEHLDQKPFMLPIWVNYRIGGGYFTLMEEGS